MGTIYDAVKAELGEGPAYASRNDFTSYHGYAGGRVIGKFDTKTAAIDAGAATTEKTFDDEGFMAARAAYQAHQTKVQEAWIARLKAENPDISDEVFNLVYAEAYERGHSAGYGEVELYLDDGLDLARKIIATVKA